MQLEFKLRPFPGANPKDYKGHVDPRLLNGDNKLLAVQDITLWHAKYTEGAVPAALRQKFTNYNQFVKYVTSYFKGRNIEVVME